VRTMLQERHRPLFSALAPEQMTLVWDRVVRAWPTDMRQFLGTTPNSPEGLFEVCRDAGLDHARVVLSLATEYDTVGRGTIETLVGHPIVPWATTVAAENNLRNPPKLPPVYTQSLPDQRVVLSVNPVNPHREGTTAWAEYRRWVVGKTVDELLRGGMSRRAMRRGPRNGWVVLGEGS
jgi:hypothetical protein